MLLVLLVSGDVAPRARPLPRGLFSSQTLEPVVTTLVTSVSTGGTIVYWQAIQCPSAEDEIVVPRVRAAVIVIQTRSSLSTSIVRSAIFAGTKKVEGTVRSVSARTTQGGRLSSGASKVHKSACHSSERGCMRGAG